MGETVNPIGFKGTEHSIMERDIDWNLGDGMARLMS